MSPLTTRNLTILLTDIKGFTDKTSRKSRAEIQQLLDRHNALVRPVLEHRGGRLVKTMGDAFLMTFESPTDAVLAGVEAQEALRAYNAGRKAADRIEIRVAINQGEVNLSDNDIFGEPVNITARIEAVADAGDVFFTEAIYLAMNKKEVPSSEVGLLQLKGIPEKVRVYRVKRELSGAGVAQLSDASPEPPPTAERPVQDGAPGSPASGAPSAPPEPASSDFPFIGVAVFVVCVVAAILLTQRHAAFNNSSVAGYPSRPPEPVSGPPGSRAPSAPAAPPAETAAASPASAAARVASRGFPSIFQAWSGPFQIGEDPLAAIARKARRDLIFSGPNEFKLKWDNSYEGLGVSFTPESLADGRALRSQLLARNPNLILLLEIRYHDANDKYLPPDHARWLRDAQGRRVASRWPGNYQLDYHDSGLRAAAAAQCGAAARSGVVDGCYFNYGDDDPDRLDLLQRARAATGSEAAIVVSSPKELPQSLPYIDGIVIVNSRSEDRDQWRRVAETLLWYQARLGGSKILCLEDVMPSGPANPRQARFATTLALTHSEAYVVFTPTGASGERGYDWQPFWDRKLGRPLGPGQPQADGTTLREFDNGTVVYNPIGNAPARPRFADERVSAATGKRSREFSLAAADGDFYLKPDGSAAR